MEDKRSADRQRCALCEREVSSVSRHHLVPKSEGGTLTVDLCAACHKTLHTFFTNRTLAKEMHSIEALRQAPEIQRYLTWVRRQPDAKIQVRTSRNKR
ncbi:MAG: HNH endonuclease [Anaerolineae bacterium]|nr:HNH endonuclease [Anaerolineae bacterium]